MSNRIKELGDELEALKLSLQEMEIYRKDEDTGKWLAKEDKLAAYKLNVRIELLESKISYLRLKEREKEQRRELAKNQIAIERAKKSSTKEDTLLKLIATMAQMNNRDINRRINATQQAQRAVAKMDEIRSKSQVQLPNVATLNLKGKTPTQLRQLARITELREQNPEWDNNMVLRASAVIEDEESKEITKAADNDLLNQLTQTNNKSAFDLLDEQVAIREPEIYNAPAPILNINTNTDAPVENEQKERKKTKAELAAEELEAAARLREEFGLEPINLDVEENPEDDGFGG